MGTVRRGVIVTMAAFAAVALAGCAPQGPDEALPTPTLSAAPEATPTPTAAQTEPELAPPEPAPPEPAVSAADADCDTMLEPHVRDALYERGLFHNAKEFQTFGFFPQGASLDCPWGWEGDTHSEVYYAWAEILPGEYESVLSYIDANGYVLESRDGGHLVVHPVSPSDLEAGIFLAEDWIAIANTPDQVWDIVLTR
jgi:hypothetical protein